VSIPVKGNALSLHCRFLKLFGLNERKNWDGWRQDGVAKIRQSLCNILKNYFLPNFTSPFTENSHLLAHLCILSSKYDIKIKCARLQNVISFESEMHWSFFKMQTRNQVESTHVVFRKRREMQVERWMHREGLLNPLSLSLSLSLLSRKLLLHLSAKTRENAEKWETWSVKTISIFFCFLVAFLQQKKWHYCIMGKAYRK
jgi:hypothetical protein